MTWTVNYYFGQEQPDGGEPDGPDGFFRVFDTYVAYTPTPTLSFGLDVELRHQRSEQGRRRRSSLQGIGVYARYQVTPPAALAIRYERLDDEGLFGGIDQVLQEVTADRWNTSSPTASWCAASSAATGRTSGSSPARGAGDLRDHQNTRARRPGVVVRQQAGSVVAPWRMSIFVALSVLFFVVGAAYVAGCRRLQ